MPLNKAKLTEEKNLTEDVFDLFFESENDFEFEAGQFITIKIDDKTPPCFRAYSICSAPSKDKKTFSLCIKIVENGRGSNWLKSLKKNDKIEFIGPIGNFLFKGEKENILFIATGTGVAPFRGMIEVQLNKGNKQKLHLLFGVRHIKDIFYRALFEELAKKHDNFSFEMALSKPENESWQGKTGRVTTVLEKMDIDPENTEVYICGLKAMIEEVTSILLKEKGLPKSSINFEKYD